MTDLIKEIWQIEINNNLIKINDDKPLKLHDLHSLIGKYIKINQVYFDELLNIIKKDRKKYTVSKSIKKITRHNGESWLENPWILIIAENTEKKVPVWMLIKRENDLTGLLIAVGPDLFYEYLNSSKDNLEDIKKILEYIVVYYGKWKTTILIPEFLP
jgi:hypothetical protein